MQVQKILEIKGTALFTIAPGKTLAEGIAIMAELDVGSLVCFENGRMVGMLTFRELLKTIHQHGPGAGNLNIADVMVRDPHSASPDMEMGDLCRLMIAHHMRYLPVMDGTTLMGVISFHDVARAVLDEQGFENKMLKEYIRDWPAEDMDKTVSA